MRENELIKTYSKTHPEGVFLGLYELKGSFEYSYYVKRSISDTRPAHSAGIRAISVDCDECAKPELMRKKKSHFLTLDPLKIFQDLIPGSRHLP
jgi:hypothetical protein